MSIIDPLRPGKAARGLVPVLTLLAALLAGCASVPYQEMSDARQAIESARPVIAGQSEPRAMVEQAEALLDEAEAHLRAGEYGAARRTAEQAKALAIQAREQADEDGD